MMRRVVLPKDMLSTLLRSISISGTGLHLRPYIVADESCTTKTDGIFVAGGDGAVEVRTLQPVAINVYSLSGAKVASQFVSGEARIELPAGVYVVNGVKIAVR